MTRSYLSYLIPSCLSKDEETESDSSESESYVTDWLIGTTVDLTDFVPCKEDCFFDGWSFSNFREVREGEKETTCIFEPIETPLEEDDTTIEEPHGPVKVEMKECMQTTERTISPVVSPSRSISSLVKSYEELEEPQKDRRDRRNENKYDTFSKGVGKTVAACWASEAFREISANRKEVPQVKTKKSPQQSRSNPIRGLASSNYWPDKIFVNNRLRTISLLRTGDDYDIVSYDVSMSMVEFWKNYDSALRSGDGISDSRRLTIVQRGDVTSPSIVHSALDPGCDFGLSV